MKIKTKMILLIMLVLIIGCTEEKIAGETILKTPDSENPQIEETIEVKEEVKEVETEKAIVKEKLKCDKDLDCLEGERCIDDVCAILTEINDDKCETKCNYKSATIETSDGDTLTLVRGKGSYTSAGAVAWKLLNSGEYCQSEDVKIPIEIEKINYGKILSKQVVTTKINQISEEITHPTVKKVKFTLKIIEIEEVCN